MVEDWKFWKFAPYFVVYQRRENRIGNWMRSKSTKNWTEKRNRKRKRQWKRECRGITRRHWWERKKEREREEEEKKERSWSLFGEWGFWEFRYTGDVSIGQKGRQIERHVYEDNYLLFKLFFFSVRIIIWLQNYSIFNDTLRFNLFKLKAILNYYY